MMLPSPCVETCRIDEASGLCIGCVRTKDEIAGWRRATPDILARIWADLPARQSRLGIGLHRLGRTAVEIGSFVAGTLRPDSGTLILGLSGAIAEFCVGPDEPVVVDRDGPVVVARTERANLRLTIADEVRSLSLRPSGRWGRDGHPRGVPGSTRAGHPGRAGRPRAGPGFDRAGGSRAERRFDLGVLPSPVRFCIRTADSGLIDDLETRVGARWPDLLAGVGGRILHVSPTRVVTAPIGRVEVLNPIPRRRCCRPWPLAWPNDRSAGPGRSFGSGWSSWSPPRPTRRR